MMDTHSYAISSKDDANSGRKGEMPGKIRPTVMLVTASLERVSDVLVLHNLGCDIAVRQSLSDVVAALVDGGEACDLLVVDMDSFRDDLPDLVDHLLHLRRTRPTPTILCAERLSDRGFVPHRLPIADASIQLPCTPQELDIGVLEAMKGFGVLCRTRLK